MTSHPPPGPATPLAALVGQVLAGRLEHDPVEATYLGDHTRDGQLPDPSEAAARERAATLRAQLAELDAFEPADRDERVDVAVLGTALAAELWELDELREAEWNPMLHNPGGGLHALVTRDFAPLPERVRSLDARLAAVPEYLLAARGRLGEMSAVHLSTCLAQLDGTLATIDTALPPAVRPDLAERAREALVEHRDWLARQAPTALRDPRLGERLFTDKLALTLDTAFVPAALLARAEADLARVTDEIVELAARIAGTARPDAGTVRTELDRLAADAPTDATVLALCRDALDAATAFVREHELVTVHDDPVSVVEMPEIDRGVAVAYCRRNGPLERRVLPTEFSVSPTPSGWGPDEVASFYREYNVHMLHELAVHEAMPGHALQLMHAGRHRSGTRVREIWSSGSFVEGWAVYAEQLMAGHGYPGAGSADALRLQQLKMQLRSILNTVLDVRYHCDDLDEAGALELMTGRGFQEHGEAVGKWRRVQLTAAQLCTYYVGWSELRDTAAALRAARPGSTERQVHDALLAHGSPPPRHLPTLLQLAAPAADGS